MHPYAPPHASQPTSQTHAIIRMTGGLGNQLFTYAFGMAMAQHYRCDVRYDLNFYDTTTRKDHECLWLKDFGFDLPAAHGHEKLIPTSRRLKQLPQALQYRLLKLTFEKTKHPLSPNMAVSAPFGRTIYTGFWQSPAYFHGIRDEVRAYIKPRILNAATRPQTVRKNVVGFHVRRGDYLNHASTINLDYATLLANGLDWLTSTTGVSDLVVSVFSDDPDWCEEHLTAPNIEINRGTFLEDFIDLMHCEHKIISNSTYGWWAAFLGACATGHTLLPRRWYAEASSDAAQLYCSGWTMIDEAPKRP